MVSVPAALDAVRGGRGRGRVRADRELGRGRHHRHPRRAGRGRPADDLPRGAAADHLRAAGAAGHQAVATSRRSPAHPAAQPQVRNWLKAHLPDAVWESAASNADGARLVQEGRYDAAFAGEFAAADVRPGAAGDRDPRRGERADPLRAGRPPRPARGADRRGQDVRGLWLARRPPRRAADLLQEFADARRQPDAASQSRPTGEGIGNYCFSRRRRGPHHRPPGGRGADGAEADLPAGAVPRFVSARGRGASADVRPLRPGTSDEEFTAAADWLARCQDGRF